MLKRLLVVLLLCVISATLASCATTYKAHNLPSSSKEELAYLVPYCKFDFYLVATKNEAIVVKKIDGKNVFSLCNIGLVEILPGKHVLTVEYEKTCSVAGNGVTSEHSFDGVTIVVIAEKGHTYAIDPILIDRDGKKMWCPTVKDITGQKGDPRFTPSRTAKASHAGGSPESLSRK